MKQIKHVVQHLNHIFEDMHNCAYMDDLTYEYIASRE
jgi:hypothetical protein